MTALDLLRASLAADGFLASPTERTNYRRVWARDGVICGLAGLASGDAALADGLRRTVETLFAHAGPQGQVPSNVAADGAVSYGGLAGRVDAGPWAVLGAAAVARSQVDPAFVARLAGPASDALALLDAWEFNARGLVYVPQSGDWADEYDLHGYLLYDQVLRLLALRAVVPFAPSPDRLAARADRLATLIEATYWPEPGGDAEAAYHPAAYRAAAETEAPFPYAALTPGGYARRFDALGSALAVLADLWPDRRDTLLTHGLRLAAATAPSLVPAFAPTVRPGDPAWATLRGNVRDTFSNAPGHYHNGGCWPMVNGWWVAALAHAGRPVDAADLLARVRAANADTFPEYLDAEHGERLGTTPLAWSAAGDVIGAAALRGPLPWLTDAAVPEAAAPASPLAPSVVVAGEVLVDFITTEPVYDLGAAATFERHAGGSPANLATNLARLGVPVALVASVGDDSLGRFLEREVLSVGVDARFATRPDRPTSVVTVARSAGTPDFAVYRMADRDLRPDQLPDRLLRHARLFHTSGFALSREPSRGTLLAAAARAAELGLALSIDVNFAPKTPARRAEQQAAAQQFLALGPLVKCSRDDLARLWGAAPASDAAAADRLRGLGASLVCLTRGADGALVVWEGGAVEVAAAPVDAVDATGAGDAFWSGFLAAWLAGAPPPDCARAGGRMAALKLARVGPLPERVDAAAVLG
ncbi:PfkB family carbohydrate kinase [Rubrivirga sp. IMCC45206]|uniref:PfkB family carbohydrate kinase n=1 Tax=Rubrivirga sp. IMCC45206 TaxID=3391614 RepID=UPI00398FAD7D